MNSEEFDVAVIGAGPGGYPAAIKAAQNGAKVALIEASEMGGTCLNRGCIPTKTLIANANVLQCVRTAEGFGINIGDCSFDFSKMAKRKDNVVGKIREGLTGLLRSNQIVIFEGFAKFQSPREIKITGKDNAMIYAHKTIIATGSEPLEIPTLPFDYERVHDSTSILKLDSLPKKLAVVGGGVIGCEFASLYVNLDVEVYVLEALPTILPTESSKVSSALSDIFTRRGVNISTNIVVEGIDRTNSGVVVRLAGADPIEADMALVAVGRKLNSDAIGLEKAGVAVPDGRAIPTNDKMETEVPGIYAIGDVTGISLLAHVATHQGLVAADNACGIDKRIYYDAIPNVVYTDPEIASVGKTLEQAIGEGLPAAVGSFPFQALGKSQASQHVEGFAQVVTHKKTGQILGAQIVGYEAGTLIAEMTLAINNELTLESLTETMHAHPTIAEVWLEAALTAKEEPLHLPPKKKTKTTTKTKVRSSS